ncbi:MAG: SIS domain-containing protein [Thermodesulfobacteriota bacterium]
MRREPNAFFQRAGRIMGRCFHILSTRVYLGKAPQSVGAGAVIFFPYYKDRLCCGLTGIVAFNRNDPPGPTPAESIDQTSLNDRLCELENNGFSECNPRLFDAFARQYLGGPDTAQTVFDQVRALKQNQPFAAIARNPQIFEWLRGVSTRLNALIHIESGHLSEQMGLLPTDQFDAMSGRIEKLKDAAWCIRTEIFENVAKIRKLLGDFAEWTPEAISAAKQINAALNSIDRLEVRGRDSAGISLLFILDAPTYADFSTHLESAGLHDQFVSRTNRDVLVNNSINVEPFEAASQQKQTAVALTYKVAAEIGSLGDNIAFIREQIQSDPIFASLIGRKHQFFTVSAHTRWASVGEINEANCHPVDNRTVAMPLDAGGIIHVCLNGDIDNYQAIKAEHEKAGHRFPEDITCDTKIIAVHVADYIHRGFDAEEAFRAAVNDFEGSHAISMHTDLAPGKFFLALKGSGQAIFVGLAPDHYVPTSEVYGFVEETPYFVKMDGEAVHRTEDGRHINGQIYVIDQRQHGSVDGIAGMFYDGSPIALTVDDIRETQLVSRDIDRQEFDHYFLKEISEAPGSVRKTLANRWKIVDDHGQRYEIVLDDTCVPAQLRGAFIDNQIRQILFIGQGTAGVAALACANLMRHYLHDPAVRVEALKSSELSGFMLEEGHFQNMTDTLLVPISQSGTTTDTNRTVDMVRKKGAWTVSIVNRRDSDLTFKSEGVIYTSSGRDIEMSVASTKAFYSQIIAGAVLSLYIAQITGKRGDGFVSNEIKQMIRLPDLMEQVLSGTAQIKTSAQRLALQRTYWAAVGSGPNKAAADEIRIKLSELCYKTISSDYVEDKKHIDLSSEPLILICAAGTRRSVLGDIVKDTAIFRSHKALPVVIADEHEDRFDAYAEDVFHVPAVSEHFAPILNTLVGHIWGYYAALCINDGSRFLHDFREDIRQLIQSYTQQNLDIFEIALEETFREKILRFYHAFRKRQFENQLPATIGIQSATNLVLLLKYLAGRLPVTDFEFDFGVKGTARNMFAMLFESLGESINAMARPVDAIKHQAKTVTVGTSRIEEKAEGLLFDLLAAKGFGIETLTLSNVMVLRNLQKIIAEIRGSTLYRISGVNLLGEPTDDTTIRVIEKQGSSAAMASRSETEQPLKGSKKIIVRQGNVYIGKGRKDARSLLIIPIISSDPSRPNMVEYLLLLEIAFLTDIALATKVKALGGKHEHIKNIVQENNIVWQDQYLEGVAMEELFGRSAEKIAETIVEKVGRA